MMFSAVGVMNRGNVEAMSRSVTLRASWGLDSIVGPGQTPLRAASTAKEEKKSWW